MSKLGSVLKFERADKHLGDVLTACKQFLNRQPYRITPDQEGNPGKLQFWITLTEEPSDDVALAAGDALHNARSALDHVVYELSRKREANPTHTSFPIQSQPADWNKGDKLGAPQISSGKHQIRLLPEGAQAIIEDLQPWKGLNVLKPDRERLCDLHRLDIADKHKNLNAAVASVDTPAIGSTGDEPFPVFEHEHRGPLKLNARTLLVRLSFIPKVEVYPMALLDITFREGFPRDVPIGAKLLELLGCVQSVLGQLHVFL